MRIPVLLLLGIVAATAADLPILVNGDMEADTDAPSGWEIYQDKGTVAQARDTVVKAAGEASLRLSSVGGPATGNTHTTLENARGTFTVNGKVKAAGVSACLVAVQVFDKDWKQIAWQNCADGKAASDWMPFTTTITIPEAAHRVVLTLMIEGDGQAWLDEVSLAK